MLRNQSNLFPANKEKMIPNNAQINKNHSNALEHNPFYNNFTPYLKQTGTSKSFYSRVNTAPVKVKNDLEEVNPLFAQNESTIDRKNPGADGKFPGCNQAIKSFLLEFDGKENDFFSPNQHSLSTSNTNRFTSNLNARNQVKNLVPEGKGFESKPALNMVESRNKLIDYSKSKKYERELIEYKKLFREEESRESVKSHADEKKTEASSFFQENSVDERKEESEDDALAKKIKHQIANLLVPLNKKDDEKFKLLKMKEMKKKSLPPNKSAQAYDANFVPTHQKDMINENSYALCKKRKSSHSAKKVYKSMLPFTNPRNSQEVHRFPLFRDNEVGVNEYWQTHLIESKADEDIPTDDEQLHLAQHYILGEIIEAFDIFEKEGVSCLRNKGFLNFSDDPYNEEEKI